jgi:flagellar hook-associated protein 1 FlgK
MANIIGLLDIGRNALLTHQRAIHTTGHNIANVNTPGYSRQRVNLAATAPMDSNPGQMGNGVTATEVQRIYDRYVNDQINAGQHDLGRWETQRKAMERVELTFDETVGFSLNQAMTDFWNSWQALSNNPEGHTERVALNSKSDALATAFNQMSKDLLQQQRDIDSGLQVAVGEINALASEIAQLNQKISAVEIGGQNANDLRDSRDLVIKQLSEMIDINTYEDGQGRVTVALAGGQPLVDGPHVWNLATQPNAAGHLNIVWTDSSGSTSDITGNIRGGKLKGWLEVRDVAIPDYLTRLDSTANGIITEVNALHTAGFDLNAVAGEIFFTGTTAADIALNPTIWSDPNRIAASSTAAGVPGDNSNAVAIAGLQHAAIMGGGTATYDDYYRALVTDVGNQVQSAIGYADHQSVMVESMENYRDSISGVSLDEEMLNLIKFQHAYDAAAKLVSTVDEMINTVMNMAQ